MDIKIDITAVKLETPRLILRPWVEGDIHDFYEYASVEGVGEMAGWKPHKSIEESESILRSFIDGKEVFALVYKDNDKVIGSLGLHTSWANADPEYTELRVKEIGYVLSKDYWGQGIMPEAVKEVIRFGFERCSLDALTIGHYAFNLQSRRVIEKCGFRFVKESVSHAKQLDKVFETRKYILIHKKFIKGMELCETFFSEVAEPILRRHFPALTYSAGLLGYGSDVLGYDDAVSTDHMWGPRFYLFLKDGDMKLKQEILRLFSYEFPPTYKGYSVNFSAPNVNDNGVRSAEYISQGPVSPLIFIHTPDQYLTEYLGTADLENLTDTDWLSISEHRLLALRCGRMFVDGLHIKERLECIKFYPETVRLFLIASNWAMIAEEQAFVKRCSDTGDEIGSILVCARIAERLMRLAFLYCGQYAPYSKWFGTAFGRLPLAANLKTAIGAAVKADTIEERESQLVLAQKLTADWHNTLELTEAVEVEIVNYFGRDIKVIFADRIAQAAAGKLTGTPLEKCPLIGTMSEVANFVELSDNPIYRNHVSGLYQ